MSKSQKKANNDDPGTKDRLREAVTATQDGQSFREAAESFDVPFPTVFKHARKGQKTRSEAQECNQKLTPSEEEVLARWIVFLGLMGQPMSKEDVTRKANDILAGKNTVGRHWYRGFFKQKSYLLAFRRSAPLDAKRCAAFNPTVVQAHFEAFEQMVTQFNTVELRP
ncbi:hypothetical protein FRC12_014269 [Ceratobasidium sp. 428]|nr:hypothetical protein FRC12_014269 [Ceratobasidium sp. 428]